VNRTLLEELITWYNLNENKPIILRGARQVGKSYLVQLLARKLKLNLVIVKLENTKVNEFDNKINFTIEKVINEISITSNKIY